MPGQKNLLFPAIKKNVAIFPRRSDDKKSSEMNDSERDRAARKTRIKIFRLLLLYTAFRKSRFSSDFSWFMWFFWFFSILHEFSVFFQLFLKLYRMLIEIYDFFWIILVFLQMFCVSHTSFRVLRVSKTYLKHHNK